MSLQASTSTADTRVSETREVRALASQAQGRKAILGFGWSALNSGSAMLIAAMVFVITSRLLGPEEFGTVALAISVITFTGCAAPGAFGEALIQRAQIRDEHLDTVFWLCMAAGVVLYALIVVLSGFVADLSSQPILATLLPFIGLKLVFDLAAVVPQALVIRQMQFKYIAARTAIGNSIGGLVCVAMALNGYGLWALATAPVVTSAVSLIILIWAAKWRPKPQLRKVALRDLWRFGIFSSGNHTLHVINLDQLILGFFAGPAMLGLYFLGKRLNDLLSGLSAQALYPVCTVFFASIQTSPDKHIPAFQNAMRVSTLLAFSLFGGLFLVADSAIPLVLGEHWQPAIPAVQAFAVIGFLGGLRVAVSSLANGLGRADIWFAFELLRYALVVIAIIALIGQGLEAVLLGIVAANLAVIPGCFIIAHKLTGVSVTQYMGVLATPLIATAAMAGVILLLPMLLSDQDSLTLLLVQIVAGSAAYLLTAFSLSGREITKLRQTFKEGKAHD
jgi:O-antigen/teichoic acid export membrane protein